MHLLLLLLLLALSSSSVALASLPGCTSFTDAAGFKHPGIIADCSGIRNLQATATSGLSPYNETVALLTTGHSYTRANIVPRALPSVVFADNVNRTNNIIEWDGLASFYNTVTWFATGNPQFLANALRLVRAWATVLESCQDHIQGATGLTWLFASAEWLRAAGDDAGWGANDTAAVDAMYSRIIRQWDGRVGLDRADLFMNQGSYSAHGILHASVWAANSSAYDRMILRSTVGDHPDPTLDYAIDHQFLGSPASVLGETREMGRDQGHPVGGLRGLELMAETVNIQGHRRGGELYEDFYTYNSSRLRDALEYWATYNLGYDVAFRPNIVRDAAIEIYASPNPIARGQSHMFFGAAAWRYYATRGQGEKLMNFKRFLDAQEKGWMTLLWGQLERPELAINAARKAGTGASYSALRSGAAHRGSSSSSSSSNNNNTVIVDARNTTLVYHGGVGANAGGGSKGIFPQDATAAPWLKVTYRSVNGLASKLRIRNSTAVIPFTPEEEDQKEEDYPVRFFPSINQATPAVAEVELPVSEGWSTVNMGIGRMLNSETQSLHFFEFSEVVEVQGYEQVATV